MFLFNNYKVPYSQIILKFKLSIILKNCAKTHLNTIASSNALACQFASVDNRKFHDKF